METWMKFALITVFLGIPAFLLGPLIWPPSPEASPTPGQLPFFMLLSLLEALFFGAGVAFAVVCWPMLQKAPEKSRKRLLPVYVSLIWLMVSWWPHDSMHIHNAMDMSGLLVIDYLFHFTLIVGTSVIAYSFFMMAAEASSSTPMQKVSDMVKEAGKRIGIGGKKESQPI